MAVLTGLLLGIVVEVPAVLAGIVSAGAGHGDYGAARALFPVPMLLTRLEGSIGPFAGGLALLQFPIYGILLGWGRARGSAMPAGILAAGHLLAAFACFAGALPYFS